MPDERRFADEQMLRAGIYQAIVQPLGLIVLARPIVALLFERGQFTATDTAATAGALIAYAVGLAGIILVKILAPGFYARQNIRTPVKVALVTLWVDPAAEQIVKYTFDNTEFDFLPGRWLVRVGDVTASMTMSRVMSNRRLHPITWRLNRSITTARNNQPSSVAMYVMSPAQTLSGSLTVNSGGTLTLPVGTTGFDYTYVVMPMRV